MRTVIQDFPEDGRIKLVSGGLAAAHLARHRLIVSSQRGVHASDGLTLGRPDLQGGP